LPNPYFRFKQFTIFHDRCAMKVTTDACLFGAWCAEEITTKAQGREGFTKEGNDAPNEPETRNNEPETLLDIGAGTGLLSLMVRQKNVVEIDAIEIDAEAAAQAAENVEASGFEGIRVLHQDLRSFNPEKTYDFIISNPPFYEDDLASGKAKKDTAHHSGQLKLDELLLFVSRHLSPDGSFFLLMPFKRHDELMQQLPSYNLFISHKTIVRQSTRHQPFRLLLRCTPSPTNSIQNEISIRDEADNYTGEFVDFLKDYYLYL
jgi:tRNA1Val (adenine37-N6)-methyltransferase